MQVAQSAQPTVTRRAGVLPAARAAGRAGVAVWLPRVLGLLALAGVVACGLLIAVHAAAGPSVIVQTQPRAFPSWVAGPLAALAGKPPAPATWALLTYCMLGAYLVLVACAGAIGSWVGIGRWLALGAVLVLHAVFALAPPIASTDIWNYIGYARLGVEHGLDPYTHLVLQVPSDPSLRWVTWPELHTPYGPLFTLLSYATVPLGVAAALWTFKAVMAAAALGCLVIVWRLARNPVQAVLFVGLNPAWVVWGVGGAHNDLLMVLAMLGAVALWRAGHVGRGGVVGAIAVGLKLPAAVLLPFLVVGTRSRGRALAGTAVGLAIVAVITLAAFGSLHPILGAQQQSGFYTYRSLLGQFGRLFGSPYTVIHLNAVADLILVVAVVALLLWVRRGGDPISAGAWAVAALVLVLRWEFPWYVAWLLPLAAIVASWRLKLVTLAFTVALLVTYVPPHYLLVSP